MDEIEKMRRNGEGQFVAGEDDSGALFLGEDEPGLKSCQGGNPIPHLPCPTIPVGWSNIFAVPVAGGSGSEFAVSGRSDGGEAVFHYVRLLARAA